MSHAGPGAAIQLWGYLGVTVFPGRAGVCVGGGVLYPRLAAGGPLVGRSPCLQRRGPSSGRKPSGAKVTKAGGEGHGERGKTKARPAPLPRAQRQPELFSLASQLPLQPRGGEKKETKLGFSV